MSPRFTLKRLLGGMLLGSLGLAAVGAIRRECQIPGAVVLPAVFFPAWFGGGALIGARLLTPFRIWWVGVVVSIPIPFVLLVRVFPIF